VGAWPRTDERQLGRRLEAFGIPNKEKPDRDWGEVETQMKTCPICGSDAGTLPRKATPKALIRKHGKFKVAGTPLVTKDSATREQWEIAPARAKSRTKADEWPLIKVGRFLVVRSTEGGF
jgi:hypothetical protein